MILYLKKKMKKKFENWENVKTHDQGINLIKKIKGKSHKNNVLF